MDWALALLMPVVGLLLAGMLFLMWRRRAAARPSGAARTTPADSGAPARSGVPEPQSRPPVPPPASLDLDDLVLHEAGEQAGDPAPGEPASSAEPGKTSELSAGSSAAPAPEPARFSAYYPKEIAPDVWLPLRAYVFRISAADAVSKDAADTLKNAITDYRPVSGDATSPLAEGAMITATPDLPGFQFNPPSASVAFFEDWQALPFRLRAISAPLDQAANGRLTFTADGIIVADLPLSIFVTAQPTSVSSAPAQSDADPYDAIFCSYSHKDTAIVERVERAYKALGLDYLRDVTTLRSGEAWNPRLLELIDQADIFQLFWSNAAADSRYVRQEWEHALALKRGEAFIRPVYWEQPMPKAPDDLKALHFHFDPTLDD